jgi:hypothetical protein
MLCRVVLCWLQGTLLFCVLLLAIWAPLLLFSSGAPTYTTPGIVGARANASFGVVTSYGHYQGGSDRRPSFRVPSGIFVWGWMPVSNGNLQNTTALVTAGCGGCTTCLSCGVRHLVDCPH